jgi:hypothetical protein
MTDYNEQTYIDACRALWRGEPTECYHKGKWEIWAGEYTPETPEFAKELQWRAVDPLHEYKEAFKAGKRVEFSFYEPDEWSAVNSGHSWNNRIFKYRIVEHKKVKLLPFAVKSKKRDDAIWDGAYYYASLQDAVEENGKDFHIAPILPDGSIEVDV